MDFLSALGAIGAGLQVADERRRKKQLEDEERAYQKTLRERDAQRWDRQQKEWSREDAAAPEADAYAAALRKAKLRELQDAETSRSLNAFAPYVQPFSTTSADRMSESVSVPSAAPIQVANRVMGLAAGPGMPSAAVGGIQVPMVQPFQGPTVPTKLADEVEREKALTKAKYDAMTQGMENQIDAGVRRGYSNGAPIPAPKVGSSATGATPEGKAQKPEKPFRFEVKNLTPQERVEYNYIFKKRRDNHVAAGETDEDAKMLAEAEAAAEMERTVAARRWLAQQGVSPWNSITQKFNRLIQAVNGGN